MKRAESLRKIRADIKKMKAENRETELEIKQRELDETLERIASFPSPLIRAVLLTVAILLLLQLRVLIG